MNGLVGALWPGPPGLPLKSDPGFTEFTESTNVAQHCVERSSVVCSFCAIIATVPPRPQDGTVSVIVHFIIVFGCVTDCNCNL